MKQSTKETREIAGKIVILRKFTEQMITDDYIGWLNDKKLMAYSELSKRTHTKESCLEYLRSFDNSPNYFWSIHRLSDNKHIGNLSAYVNKERNSAELALLIGDKNAHGTGAGREAWSLGMEFLFTAVAVRKVVAGTLARNIAMVKVMEHNGMILEGTLREQVLFDNQGVDGLLYGMFKKEWLEFRAANSGKDGAGS